MYENLQIIKKGSKNIPYINLIVDHSIFDSKNHESPENPYGTKNVQHILC